MNIIRSLKKFIRLYDDEFKLLVPAEAAVAIDAGILELQDSVNCTQELLLESHVDQARIKLELLELLSALTDDLYQKMRTVSDSCDRKFYRITKRV